MAMISLMHQLVNQGCQFVIATHSPIVLSYPNAKILEIRENGLEEVDYEDTDTFAVTKQFLNKYESILEILLKDED